MDGCVRMCAYVSVCVLVCVHLCMYVCLYVSISACIAAYFCALPSLWLKRILWVRDTRAVGPALPVVCSLMTMPKLISIISDKFAYGDII